MRPIPRRGTVGRQLPVGKQPGEADLAALRDAFAEAMRHARIAERDAGCAWDWTTAP